MNLKEFEQDKKTIFAVTHAIEIIGEATKQITPEIRENSLLAVGLHSNIVSHS